MRKTLRLIILSALLGSAMGTPAHAQWERRMGSIIPSPKPAAAPIDSRLSEADAARLVLARYGKCVVLSSRPSVLKALAVSPFNPKYHKSLEALTSYNCLNNGMLKMSDELMRGSLFMALYQTSFAKKAPALLAAPVDYLQDVSGDSQAQEKAVYVALRRFGDCLVRADPADARELVLTDTASKQESKAIAALVPLMNGCMIAGLKVNFGKEALIALIAETLYRASDPVDAELPITPIP